MFSNQPQKSSQHNDDRVNGRTTSPLSIRARMAALAHSADRLAETSSRQAPMRLALLSDPKQPAPLSATIRTLPRGSALILRHYDHPARLRLARHVRALASNAGVLFYLAGAIQDAIALGADGVHLPGAMAQQYAANTVEPHHLLVSVACHNQAEINAAHALGAHSIFISPVFSTSSHLNIPALGVKDLSRLALGTSLPVLALGGINTCSARHLIHPAICGFGAIDAFYR